MNLNVKSPRKTWHEIFPDVHDANFARHYLAVIKTQDNRIHRDLTGHFYRTGPHSVMALDDRASNILDRLQRNEVIVPAKKPEYFTDDKVGYRMALACD